MGGILVIGDDFELGGGGGGVYKILRTMKSKWHAIKANEGRSETSDVWKRKIISAVQFEMNSGIRKKASINDIAVRYL